MKKYNIKKSIEYSESTIHYLMLENNGLSNRLKNEKNYKLCRDLRKRIDENIKSINREKKDLAELKRAFSKHLLHHYDFFVPWACYDINELLWEEQRLLNILDASKDKRTEQSLTHVRKQLKKLKKMKEDSQ